MNLIDAIKANNLVEVRRLLVEQHVSVNTCDENEIPALNIAILNVEYDDEGNTIRSDGIYANRLPIARLLLQHGADVNLGENPLALALDGDYSLPEIVEDLLLAGASVNTPSKSGYGSPLLLAVVNGNVAVVTRLLEPQYHAEVNAKCLYEGIFDFGDHITPLHYAAHMDNTEMVRLLLNADADPNVTDKDGYTPILYDTNIEITQLLLEHGANPHVADKDGGSAVNVDGGEAKADPQEQGKSSGKKRGKPQSQFGLFKHHRPDDDNPGAGAGASASYK